MTGADRRGIPTRRSGDSRRGGPRCRGLRDAALGIESDHGRAWQALTVLARPELILGALTKGYEAPTT